MKRLLSSVVFAVLLTVVLGSQAFGAAALELVVGSGANYSTLYVADNAGVVCTDVGTSTACTTAVFPLADLNPSVGGVSVLGVTFGSFLIDTSSGRSNDPNCVGVGPGCLNDTNINALSTGAGSISVFFAGTGFAAGVPGFAVAFSSPLQTGASATQTAYVFTGANPLGAGILSPIAGSVIGSSLTITPPGVAGLSTSGANPFLGAFGLELATEFTAVGAGTGFNANGNIAPVPEPATVALFGTALVLCATGLRRKQKRSA